jgi:hypothetical protein
MPRLTAGHNIFLAFQGASEIIPLHNLFIYSCIIRSMQFKGKTGCPPCFFLWVSGLFLPLLFVSLFISGCSLKYAGPERVKGGVRFAFEAENAKRVAIVGGFNQWDPGKDLLSGPDSDGMWEITIPILEGRYEYLFLINGEKWVLDPTVPFVDDGLGGKNSVVSIKR